jgi:hypothetical protein
MTDQERGPAEQDLRAWIFNMAQQHGAGDEEAKSILGLLDTVLLTLLESEPVVWREKYFHADCTLDGLCGVVEECCQHIKNTPEDAYKRHGAELLDLVLTKLHNALLTVQKEYTDAEAVALFPPAAESTEPVAWRTPDRDGSFMYTEDRAELEESAGYAIVPLYTLPPAAEHEFLDAPDDAIGCHVCWTCRKITFNEKGQSLWFKDGCPECGDHGTVIPVLKIPVSASPAAERDQRAMEVLRRRVGNADLRWHYDSFHGRLCLTTQNGASDPADAILSAEGGDSE